MVVVCVSFCCLIAGHCDTLTFHASGSKSMRYHNYNRRTINTPSAETEPISKRCFEERNLYLVMCCSRLFILHIR